MKSLLMGLLIIATAGIAEAASTDTVTDSPDVSVGQALQDMAVFMAALQPTDAPAEQKVVEIHMASPELMVPESRRSRKIAPLPLSNGTCSGSFIDDHGDILTAKHCVTNFTTFLVQTYDRRMYKAVVIATSPVQDLALLHIARRDTPYFRFASSVRRGEDIWTIGSPLGITDIVTQGIIAKLDGDDTLLDCGVLPGNSGGPVINKNHELVGVVIAGYTVMLGVTHLNVAQSLDAVVDFVEKTLGDK